MDKRGKGRKLVSLCVLGMVFFLMLSLMPSYVVPADARSYSSVIITDVEPTEFNPGDTKEVTVTVKNNGGSDAQDVRLAFQETEFVSLVGPTVAQANWLNSWCSEDVKIVVHVKDEAPTGTYRIPIICDWYEKDTKTVIVGYKTVTIGVPPHMTETIPQTKMETFWEPRSALLGISFDIIGRVVVNIGDVSTDPTDVKPGYNNVKITAFIENSGEAAAKDVETVLICNNAEFKPSWSSTDRSYLGRLNSGDSKEAIFHVDVTKDIKSKTYSIPLRIRYRDTKNEEHEVMRELNILVQQKPEFKIVSAHTEPASLKAGDKNVRLHVKIRNTGTENAESVTVRITREAEVPFDYDVLSGYVGNLKIGEEGEAIMKFDVDHDALPKVYHQGIEIRCTGDLDLDDDNVYITDTECLLEVSSGSSFGGLPIPGFEVLFSLLALILVFVLIKRRKGV